MIQYLACPAPEYKSLAIYFFDGSNGPISLQEGSTSARISFLNVDSAFTKYKRILADYCINYNHHGPCYKDGHVMPKLVRQSGSVQVRFI